MPSFGKKSRQKLETLDPRLRKVLERAIEDFDFTILEGHRTKDAQIAAFEGGNSKVEWPNSKHNTFPSKAVDIAPWFPESPHVRWDDWKMWYYFGGYIMRCAKECGVKLRWGANWDLDMDFNDHSFIDCPHFELDES